MKSTLRVILLLAGLALLSFVSLHIPIPGVHTRVDKADQKLVIITPHWDGVRNEFDRAFPPWYKEQTGHTITIEWLDPGGTSDCLRYVKSEFSRKKEQMGIDLFFGGGTDPYLEMKRAGILAPVAIDTMVLKGIPQNLNGIDIYDNEGYWFGTALAGFGIMYNKRVLQLMQFAVPTDWKSLIDKRYTGWIGAADPRNSGTMHMMFEIILQVYGWDEGWGILSAIAANARPFSQAASDLAKMVAKGDMAYGLSIDFYAWEEVSAAGEDKVGFILPQDLTVITADAIAMLKGAPNPAAAAKFIAFQLSEAGQKIWFCKKGIPGGPYEQELNRLSIRPEFYEKYRAVSNVRENPFSFRSTFRFDQKKGSKRWMLLNDLIGTSIIDNARELKKAWRSEKALNDSSWSYWKRMPLDEAGCVQLIDSVWSDPSKKNETLLSWQTYFRKKYRGIEKASVFKDKH